jgi:hypothetical protein
MLADRVTQKNLAVRSEKLSVMNSLLQDIQTSYVGLDINTLQETIAYFSYLYTQGEITEKALEALVSYACSVFIENEMESRIQMIFKQKLTSLFS